MGYLLDAMMVRVMGAINVAVFWGSRRRRVIYRFDDVPNLQLTKIGDIPFGLEPVTISYLRDGGDYILLMPAYEAEPNLLRDLRAAKSVSAEIVHGTVHTALTVVANKESAESLQKLSEQIRDNNDYRRIRLHADVTTVSDEADRARLLRHILSRASLGERYDVRREHLVPIARLTPH